MRPADDDSADVVGGAMPLSGPDKKGDKPPGGHPARRTLNPGTLEEKS